MLKRLLGFIFIFIGIFLFINSFSFAITGNAIINPEYLTTPSSFLLSVIFILVGIYLIHRTQDYRTGKVPMWYERDIDRESSRGSNTSRNREARYAARRLFEETYGRAPESEELKDFQRALHDEEEIDDAVSSRRRF